MVVEEACATPLLSVVDIFNTFGEYVYFGATSSRRHAEKCVYSRPYGITPILH